MREREAFPDSDVLSLGSKIDELSAFRKQAVEDQSKVVTTQVPLGGGRPGTTGIKVGGQGANAALNETKDGLRESIDLGNFLQVPKNNRRGFLGAAKSKDAGKRVSGVLDKHAGGLSNAIDKQIETNTDDRNRSLRFIAPFQQSQRRSIRLSNEIQTGRRRRRSSSTDIPLAAGLLTRTRAKRLG